MHLVVFYTEGRPNDAGVPLAAPARVLIARASCHFSSVVAVTPRSLIEADDSWREEFQDYSEQIRNHPGYSPELRVNTSWARMGLLRWKPRLIMDFLTGIDVKEGDIVLYHDADTEKYPDYLFGVERWAKWLRRRMEGLDVLCFDDNHAPLASDAKPELFDVIPQTPSLSRPHHIWAGAIAVRKSPGGQDFVSRWFELCTFDNVSPITKQPTPEGFVQNSVDQAVLGSFWYSLELSRSEIRRDVQYLYRSRKIPPPGRLKRLVASRLSRIQKVLNR